MILIALSGTSDTSAKILKKQFYKGERVICLVQEFLSDARVVVNWNKSMNYFQKFRYSSSKGNKLCLNTKINKLENTLPSF